MTLATAVAAGIDYACPRCRADLLIDSGSYVCVGCAHAYPVVLGIPDFRVFPDPWISLEDDREKARRLEEASRGRSLEETVRAYWAMTPGTPAHQAERFVRYVLTAQPRAREWLARVEATDPATRKGPLLEIGAGTGDLVVAAHERGHAVVGADIAMRWLVVARRRAALAGIEARLVCCNGEHLPFPDASFDRVLSVGTLEHCRSAEATIREARRVLRPRGILRARTVNRFSLTAEPHVGVWGVGFVPRRWADAWVRAWSDERYLHHRPLSRRELARAMREAGFASVGVAASPLLQADRERLGRLSLAAPVYERMRRAPLAGSAVAWVAPLLEARGVA